MFACKSTHPHLALRLKKKYSYTSTPLWDFMACFTANFTFWMQKIFVTILYYNNLNITQHNISYHII